MDALEELNYRGLQKLAKTNGVKANGSKEDLKTRIAAALLLTHDTRDTKLTGESSTLRGEPGATATADELGVCCRTSDDIPDSDSKVAIERARDNSVASQPTHAVDYEAQAGKAQPGEVPLEASQGSTSARLFANKESHAASRDPRETRVKKPNAGPGLRFERMHQTLFAGQTSIERYGKTPKKPASARENMLMHKNQRFSPISSRPVAYGSGVKSAKRGVTVASKPPTLVVQRSTKKPTKVMEFQLSGRREAFTFRPYSGPVRPITPDRSSSLLGETGRKASSSDLDYEVANIQMFASLLFWPLFHVLNTWYLLASVANAALTATSKTASFNVGCHSNHAPDDSGPKGIKATLASGRSHVSRRNAKIESRKAQREKKIEAQRRAGC